MTNVPVWVYPATTVKITLQDIPAKILTDNTFIQTFWCDILLI